MDEREAVARMKRGHISGLATLVERHQVRAVRTAFLITGDRALAEDVVQATFIRLYQHIDKFDSSRPFAPWLMRSVVNAAVQAAQKAERDTSLDLPIAGGDLTLADLFPDDSPGMDESLEASEVQQAVREALKKLPPEQRAAIVMRYYLDLTEDEMADQMDSPPGTVKWRLHAARKHLRVLLASLRGEAAPGWKEGT